MLRQYQVVKSEYPDAIVMFRMGDFYEMFGEDARLAADVLDIVLTSRNKGETDALPMCGVPHHAVSSYLARLVKAGHKVAICDQMEDPKLAKGIVRREVTRVVTPGTLDDEQFLAAEKNNYIVSLALQGESIAMAWVDVTTGEFMGKTIPMAEASLLLQTEVARLEPAEIIVPERLFANPPEWFVALKQDYQGLLSGHGDWAYVPETAYETLTRQFAVRGLEGFGLTADDPVIPAAGSLLDYLQSTQKQTLTHIQHFRLRSEKGHMTLDAATISALELVDSRQPGQKQATLLSLFDAFIQTPMGRRLLKKWMLSPLHDVPQIVARLEGVDRLAREVGTRDALLRTCATFSDLERLAARLSMRRISPPELIRLRQSVEGLPQLASLLVREPEGSLLCSLGQRIHPEPGVVQAIVETLRPDPAAVVSKGGVIQDGFHAELDELRAIRSGGKNWLKEYEATIRTASGIGTLKIGYNRVFGYYLEVSKAQSLRVPENFVRKQTLVNAERYITDELKTYEAKILGADERIVQLEQELYEGCLEALLPAVPSVLGNAELVAEVDVLLGFAQAAVLHDYVRPVVNTGHALVIKGGRHPIVERLVQSERFIANDSTLQADDAQILVITGPNMAGKSTYLRQVALITLMAQMGSFVPAEGAEIGMVDRIFTRIGAADNLARGQSTFMVEMQETANILHHATPRSLIILDEIGRGTSTFDGLAIAWAVIEFLQSDPSAGPRTLFATHYHELIQLAEDLPRVRNYNIAVQESGGDILFLRKIVPGGVDDSYGVQVARLAGLPSSVIVRAAEILRQIESTSMELDARVQSIKRAESQAALPLFSLPVEPHPAVRALREITIESLTPLAALNKLAELKVKSAE